METALTKFGYRIPRTNENEKYFKKLTIYPKQTSKINYNVKPKPVICYRKSKGYIYVPRYFGYKTFGPPKIIHETTENEINVKFEGKLRDYQEDVIEKTLKNFNDPNLQGGFWHISTGGGKCNGVDTPILMYDGTIKKVQNVRIGDQLMGDDSTPRNVLSLARGKEELYEIKPVKGESYVVNKSHILSLRCTANVSKKYKKNCIIDISVTEYLKQNKKFKHIYKGYRVKIDFQEKKVPFDPYLLGLWLGDGTSSTSEITNQDSAIIKYLLTNLPKYNCYADYNLGRRKHNNYSYSIKSIDKTNYFWEEIKKMNLKNNKHIPHRYLCNSRKNRLSLLAGLIDSDGYLGDGCYEITQKNKILSDGILFLCRSLGFGAYQKKCKKSCMYKGEKREGIYYRINFSGEGVEDIPCLVPRKKALPRKQKKNVLNYGFKIIEKGIDNYYGFEIDGNHRYVLGDFTVTHNTTIALNLISKIKLKTIIIVHKEFLMNQWIERIEQFLPGTRIGKIQGKILDIEDKDIVIGMLQSIALKDLDVDVFSSFGILCVDESHCINSVQFSKALFKINTKYKLGLSATPHRADELDKVFEYHVGPKIIELSNTVAEPVIHVYNTPFSNDVTVSSTYTGNTNMAKLITDVSMSNIRNDYIIEIVQKYVIEDRSILIFTDRVEHCRILKKKLQEILFDKTVGLFVGKMSKEERENSMECDIIICTYSIAREGFDLKKLDTLLMATPRSDVVQVVGRILRQVNKNIPVVIDLKDKKFDIFMGQYYKRRKHYKDKQYKIFNYNEKEEELVEEGSTKKEIEKGLNVCKIINE